MPLTTVPVELESEIITAYHNGETDAAIEKRFNLSRWAIRKFRKKLTDLKIEVSSRQKIDLSGKIFHRLVVLNKAEKPPTSNSNQCYWKCKCECGNEITITTNSLKSGHTKSCGCLQREILSANMLNNKHAERHGKSNTPEWLAWKNCISRCHNTKDKNYADYGGRGISVHLEWRVSFEAFFAYVMENLGRRLPGMLLDRINNNGNYEPGNIRWADSVTSNRNRRDNWKITHEGKTLCGSAWVEIAKERGNTELSTNTFLSRLRRGWSVDKALAEQVKKRK